MKRSFFSLGIIALIVSMVSISPPMLVSATGDCEPTVSRESNGVLVPPDYHTFQPPAVGGWYCDETFGTVVKRLTGSQNGYASNSEIAYFNVDDSYFIATDDNITYLYDGNDGHRIKEIGGGTLRSWWIRWARAGYYTAGGVQKTFDPAKHFYKYEGNEVRLYNVETMTYVVLHRFEEYSAIGPAGGEGDVSQDGRYWVMDGKRKPESDGQLELFVYDLLDDQKGSVSPFEVGDLGGKDAGVDYATISPSGKYIVIAWHAGLKDPYNGHYGVEVFERETWKPVSRVHPCRVHIEMGLDAFGEEVVFTGAGNSAEEIESFNIAGLALGDQVSVRMRDGFARKLLDVPRWAPFVLSYSPGLPGYIFVGYDKRSDSPETLWAPYWGEIYAVATDGSGKAVRLVHHRSWKVGNQSSKEYQPDFFVSNKGDKIVLNSTFGLGRADLYMFDTGLVGGVQPPPPPPPPPANHAPVAYGGSISTMEGKVVSGQLSASDGDGDSLTYAIVTNGSLGKAALTNTKTGAYTYTPNAGASGTDTFTFKVSDGKAESNAATVTVTIKPKSVTPVRAKLRLVSNNYAYPGEGWDNAIDGDTVGWDGTVTAKDNPPYAIFAFADGSTKSASKFRLITDTGVALQYPKLQSRWVTQFTVQVSTTDTNSSSFRTVLDKAGKNGSGWQDYAIQPAQAKYIKLILDQPSSGWRQIGEFEVYVGGSDPGTPPPVNQPPVAQNGSVSTVQDTAVSGQLSASDGDGDPLTYVIVTNGSLGKVVLTDAKKGTYTYTPNAGASGTDTFTFKVSDGKAESNAATVTVTIKPKSVSPVRAKLRLVSSNYAYPGEGWDNAIDGDTVGWDGTVTAKDNPPYAIFAFADNSKKTVSKIRLMTDTGVASEYPKFKDRWVTQFTVQVSTTDTNSSSFRTVLDKAGKNGGGWQDYAIQPAQAKYIKLILDQPSSEWRQIGEFEVYVNQ